MHWELSEEQELYTTSLREWLQERAALATVRSWLDSGSHTDFEHMFVSEGWAGVGFDESAGGQGGGLLELALTARELGRAAVPWARGSNRPLSRRHSPMRQTSLPRRCQLVN
jgi:alkylation response protein AidB-like acyl-CoA dehydrogenase